VMEGRGEPWGVPWLQPFDGVRRRGRWGAKRPKLSHLGSISGAPLEMATGDNGGRWFGGAYEVMGAAGWHVWPCKRERRVWGQNLETEPLGLDFRLAHGCMW
jgi:hypothetical protein